MSTCTANAPKAIPIVTEAGAFVSASGYAAILTTKLGQRVEREHTWFVVMIGVMLTLAWFAAEDSRAAKRAFVYFICTGLPIIARALYLQSQEYERTMNAHIDRGTHNGPKT